ncbi:hypothetical protein Enr17x_10700 [Gimesia fumaroli]|uniref:Uncharacterized protein n=1 Tax=Gimesia fumaroli TaxID=2527976 RepID=A0A518I7I1_9PLAN|nr:hypothetical protein Enr17x_10700 [Gimesia fumaroli]
MLRSAFNSLFGTDQALRCRLIIEVRVSSVLGNRAETSGFYSADILSGFETSPEPVVLTRARDVISAC